MLFKSQLQRKREMYKVSEHGYKKLNSGKPTVEFWRAGTHTGTGDGGEGAEPWCRGPALYCAVPVLARKMSPLRLPQG